MTQVQENLMVKWLNDQLDDVDATLLIPNFDPKNLRYNLDCVDNMKFCQKSLSHCWDNFLVKLSVEK